MFSDVTPAVARALESAQRYAQDDGASEVQPQHLLHALLEEQEGRAAVHAQRAGLDWNAYRTPLAHHTLTDLNLDPEPRPLHDRTQNAVVHARRRSRELLHEDTVSGEMLLFALLETEEKLRRLLELLGLRFRLLRKEIFALRPPPLQLDEPLRLEPLAEHMDTARVLDAAANRAREGLRVVEDYCRFVLDDIFLTGELKQIRHDLAAALASLPAHMLLEARDTQHDVGTHVSLPSEQHRQSPLDVAAANLKRLQEALRSLEEFGKVHSAALSSAVEQMRYRVYTLERAIVIGASTRDRMHTALLQVLLSASSCLSSVEWTIKEAVAGGADLIQLREKGTDDNELLRRAREARRWTHEAGGLFIVNDRPDVARLVEADGVHLGQEDFPVHEARRIVGPDAIIGVSTHNIGQVRQAVRDGATYIGVGPAFPSGTKTFAELPGLEFVRAALAETTLPAFVIGGVNAATIGEAVAAGAKRVAVSQAVARSETPRAAAMQLRLLLTARPSSSAH
jgi:thiamine-phosphate pyrophosphorylase